MPHDDSQERNLKCYSCGSDNYPYASFCIACGEPLELEGSNVGKLESSTSELPTFQPSNVRTFQLKPPLSRWETWLGVAILLLVTGYAVFQWQKDVIQSSAYREGAAAVQHKDWDRAVSAFKSAGDHGDATRRYADALQKVLRRDT